MKTCSRILSLVLAGTLLFAVPAPAAEARAAEPFRYYDQLDENQQALYDRLLELDTGEAGSFTLRLPDPVVYSGDAEGNSKAGDRKFSRIAQGALDALTYDEPSRIWIDKDACSSSGSAKGSSNGSDRYQWKISSLIMNVAALPKAVTRQKALDAALFDSEGGTRYERVKYLHDRLCELVVYEDTAQSRSPYGALVEGKAVCEGYAKAFKILCDRAGIPCVIVSGHGVTTQTGPEGQNHMWNYVQMEDGKWYGVDVTWDDQKDQICRDFFLVGEVTLSSQAFGHTTFGQSHVPDGDVSRSGMVFEYPELNPRMYRPEA